MKKILEIVEKIEVPLNFLSREPDRNLSLVKGLESTMSAFFDELEVACRSMDHISRKEFEDNIEKLKKTFFGFDNLSENDKKKRVDDALVLIEKLRTIHSERRPVSRDQDIEDLEKCFEKLSMDVLHIKGVGPKIAELLAGKGIKNIEDMLYFLPRGYEDRRYVRSLSSVRIGHRETVMGNVTDVAVRGYKRRRVLEVAIDDGSGKLTAKWFQGNFSYLQKIFKKGRRVLLTGDVKGFLFGKDMLHPDYEVLDKDRDELLNFKRIVPVYSETEGLGSKYIRKIMMRAVSDYSGYVLSPVPDDICRRNGLVGIGEAINNVHFPGFDQDIEKYRNCKSESHRRLIFDEFFFFELGMALKKRGHVLEEGISFKTDGRLYKKFCSMLPFEMTGAQKRVIEEIKADMRNIFSMNRLLQGDVGCGKTVVSMAAMVCACENAYQAAIMAPTEILAEQHYSNIKEWSAMLGLKALLLTGGVKSAEKKSILRKIKSGDADIVIGTHALIQEGVEFRKLGFVVIDEQHRFGVMQRANLKLKGAAPDVLIMTATPIPRSLAMTVYGDLDISVIDEVPPGKKPIRTKVFYDKSRDKVYEIIRKELEKGNQAFIVYPLVEESEALDLKDATKMAEHLQNDVFPEYRIKLMHGRMKSTEKDKIMADFSEKRADILVSTTVIEVGIDIPGASLMVIEHAERFGLSQLHQLRGRVGRSDIPSYCILVAGYALSDVSRKRLRIMEETNDGFRVAEEDLAIRGPGEFMGTRQSGLPDFRVANIFRDGKILNDARRDAFSLVEKDPCLQAEEHALLKKVLLKKWEGKLTLAKTG